MYGFKPGSKPKDKDKGGKIEGPGTGTSDSIKTEIPKGSYIMPADSTQQVGPKALDDLGEPVPVNVSNGEYQMPPEQVHAVGVQALNQMRDATHMPAPAGFKPQKDGLYFADGGLIADAAQYWANDNEQFEAGNPSFGSRVVRALNPATSFGSAMGAMHTAAGSGDKTGMALAAAQAVPVFGAMRSVITPAMGAVKAARAMAPSAAQTGAAIAGSGAAGAMADAYGSPAVAAEPQQSSAAFSDMQREPNIPRREEPRLGFADGGSPAEEERRRLPGNPLAVTYGDMTGRPGASPAPRPQQAAAAMPSVSYNDLQRAPSIPQPSGPSPSGAINTSTPPRPGDPAAAQPPAQAAGFGAAPEQAPQGVPASFSSMQREPNIPRSGQPRQMPQGEPLSTSGVVDGLQAAGQQAAAGIQGAVDQAAQAGRGFVAGGQAMTEQAATAAGSAVDAASGALNYLNRGDPVKEAASAVGGFFARSSDQARLADYGNTGAPSPIEATPAAAPTPPAPAARTGYGFTPDPMQGPAPGMSVRPTSAEGISRIDNAPGLKSPLFTNLPTGEAISGMQGGTVNTVPALKAPAATQQAPQPAGFQPYQQQSPAGGVIGNSDASRRDRDTLIRAASTPYRGAQSGQITANQLRTLAGLQDGDQRAATEAANQQAATERVAMQEAGANSRALSRDEIDRRRADTESVLKGFEARGMERAEKLYAAYESAKTPEERAAVAEQLRVMSGKDAPNRFTVAPGGQEVTAQGLLRTVPSVVLNNQTGQLVDLGAAPRQGGAQATQRPVGTTSTVNGKTAVWDGSKWVPR